MGKAYANFGSSRSLESKGARQWALLAFIDQEESESWGVTCQVDEISSGVPGQITFRISWGNGGVQHQVELTPQLGFTVNIHGSSIKVEASFDTDVAAGTANATVSASISDQDSGRPQPIFVINTDAPDPVSGSVTVELPQFTREIMIIPFTLLAGVGAGAAWNADFNFFTLNFDPNEKMQWTPIEQDFVILNDPSIPAGTGPLISYWAVFCQLSI